MLLVPTLAVSAYLAAVLLAWYLLVLLIRSVFAFGRCYAAHVSLLGVFAVQGLVSLILALCALPLSYGILALIMFGVSGALLPVCISAWRNAPVASDTGGDQWLGVLLGYGLGIGFGVIFFTTDLLPSSMTGDPARHYFSLLNLHQLSVAPTYKPIYYIWCGALVHLTSLEHQDQVFVLANCFFLGALVTSAILLVEALAEKVSVSLKIVVAVLVAAGYPLFALQYGYYALLLSAAFALCFLACALAPCQQRERTGYWLASLMFAGVVLTHSYFVPELALVAVLLYWVRTRVQGVSPENEAWRVLPCWAVLLLIAVISNPFFFSAANVPLTTVVSGQGFGTDNLAGNVLPFACALLPLWFVSRPDKPWSYCAVVASLLIFTALMWCLSVVGIVHTYYVNRNLIVMVPVLVAGLVFWFDRLAASWRFLVVALLVCLVGYPYLSRQRLPLALAHQDYRVLLARNDQFVYLANAEVASYSPLQFTARDRQQLMNLHASCGMTVPRKMAVLGTDHAVIWIGNYGRFESPLEGKWNQFIVAAFNEDNYRAWLQGSDNEYVLLVKHINYEVPTWVITGVKSQADLICQGDSFEVYRKRASLSH